MAAHFLSELRRGLEAWHSRCERVLVAVSGGADSVALLCGLTALQSETAMTITAAHLNHGYRGASADADADWVRALAARLHIPSVIESSDVVAISVHESQGIEETGRHVRYQFLARTAANWNCDAVAVAHTADDQAETILHNILRGTGLAGLAGMPRTRPLTECVDLIRPLIDISRSDVERYLQEIGQEFREDASNSDLAFTRNRIRHTLLPFIEAEFNPQIRGAVLRLGHQAAEAQQAISAQAAGVLARAQLDASPEVCRLRCDVLAQQPRHLMRTCFEQLWRQQNWPRQRMGFGEWERLAELITGSGIAMLPGEIEARRRNNLLVLRRRERPPPMPPAASTPGVST